MPVVNREQVQAAKEEKLLNLSELKRHTTDAVQYQSVFGKLNQQPGGNAVTSAGLDLQAAARRGSGKLGESALAPQNCSAGSALLRAHCQTFGSRNALYIPPFQKAKVMKARHYIPDFSN